MTESEWQAQVVQLMTATGWHHLHVRRTIGRGRKWVTATNVIGWPDIYAWHPRQSRTIAVELKSANGKLTAEQHDVLRSLAAAGVETYVWRPADLDEAVRVLNRKAAA